MTAPRHIDTTITSVEVTAMPLPVSKPMSSALATYAWVDCTGVEIRTAGGLTGWGYTFGVGGSASAALVPYISKELAPAIIGRDVLSPEALWHVMFSPNKARMRGGIGAWGLSAVDIACWDVVAKAAGLPLATLLGGFRDSVAVYGSGGWLSLDDAELVAECQAYLDQGITAYKLKVGGPRDRDRLALLRREVGDDVTLFVDANQAYNSRTAIELSRMLAEFGVAWLEEPVVADAIDDLAHVARHAAVPTAAGENSYLRWGFRDLCERRAVRYLQPDVMRCGGITEFRKISVLADAFGVDLTTHLAHELSTTLIAATPAGYMVEYMELMPPDLIEQPFMVERGRLSVPQVPGHGAGFVPDVVARYAAGSVTVTT